MPRILTHDDVERLFAQAGEAAAGEAPPANAVRMLLLLELLYGSGLRASELVSLPRRAVTGGREFLIIRGKGGKKNKTLFVDRAEDPEFVLENNISLDTEYYVNKQILPPVMRIFESFGVNKDRLCSSRAQSSLFSFAGECNKPQKQKSLFDF